MIISLLNSKVTFQYHIIGMINEKIVPILIDTGAAWSHVSKEICENFEILSEPRTVLKFDSSLKIMSQSTIIRLKLRKLEEFQLKILIDEQPNKFLFGIDFLEQFEYSITSEYLLLDGSEQPRHKIHEETIKSFLKNYHD